MSRLTSPQNQRRLRQFFLFLGIVLFAYLLYRVHPLVLWQHIRAVGWNFLWVMAWSTVWYLSYALAWEVFLKGLSTRVHLWNIFKIKVAGEAINSVTPLSWGGGDPARVYLLKNHIPLTEGTASVIVDRTLNNLAIALFMIVGVLLLFLKFSLPRELKIGVLVGLSIILLVSVFFYLRSHEGLFQFLIDLLKKLRIKKNFSESTLKTLYDIDRQISHFYKQNKKGFFWAFLLHFFGRIAGAVEIYLIGYFLGLPITFTDAYLLASMTVLVNMVFIFVPGALGVMELAYTGIFSLLGLNPAVGTSLQVLRRARMLLWVALGFVFMAGMKNTHPVETKGNTQA